MDQSSRQPAIYSRLDKMGFHVFAGCLTQDGFTSISETCSSHVTAINVNVTKVDSIEKALDEVKTKLPDDKSLWAVVNNAGVAGPAVTTEMCTKEDYLNTCDVNLFGSIEVSRIFMPLLRNSRGRLVNMASMAGRVACHFVPYSVSKFGMEAFCDVVRQDVRPFGVKVCIIEPYFFKTAIIELNRFMEAAIDSYRLSSSEVKAAYGSNYLEKLRAKMAGIFEHASDETHKVVDAYISAITSKCPKDRYVVGNMAKFVAVPMSLMPAWISDRVFLVYQALVWKDSSISG